MLPLEASGSGPLGPLLPHDPVELYVGIGLFLLIFVVIWKVAYPKFEATYAERREQIEGGMERASAAEAKAQAALAEYTAMMESVDEEASAIREEARTQGAKILADSRAKAQSEADRIVTQAQAQIEVQRQQAQQQLQTEVGSMATVLAGKIVGENMDSELTSRTIDRFLADLEADQA